MSAGKRKDINVKRELERSLPALLLQKIREIGLIAQETGARSYLVGGCVRDMFLHRPLIDIDIGIEGDASTVARLCKERLGCTILSASRFGTVSLRYGDGVRIDLAASRAETYEKPAALPTVKSSVIIDDLARRDFTINALAVFIDPIEFGRLIDPFEGLSDLKSGAVRILHDRSFIDDPTRIMRAVRFESRLGFRMEAQTVKLARRSIKDGYPEQLSGKRLLTELTLILKDANPVLSLTRMKKLGLLRVYHPKLFIGRNASGRCRRLENSLDRQRVLHPEEKIEIYKSWFHAMAEEMTGREIRSFLTRMGIAGRPLNDFLKEHDAVRKFVQNPDRFKSLSQSFSFFQTLSIESLIYLHARCRKPASRRRVEEYLEVGRYKKLEITGADLLSMGFTQGRDIGRVLQEITEAMIEGETETRTDKLERARRILARTKSNKN